MVSACIQNTNLTRNSAKSVQKNTICNKKAAIFCDFVSLSCSTGMEFSENVSTFCLQIVCCCLPLVRSALGHPPHELTPYGPLRNSSCAKTLVRGSINAGTTVLYVAACSSPVHHLWSMVGRQGSELDVDREGSSHKRATTATSGRVSFHTAQGTEQS